MLCHQNLELPPRLISPWSPQWRLFPSGNGSEGARPQVTARPLPHNYAAPQGLLVWLTAALPRHGGVGAKSSEIGLPVGSWSNSARVSRAAAIGPKSAVLTQ